MKTSQNSAVHSLLTGLILVIASLSPLSGWSQSSKPGSVEYLNFCNGIGNLLLGQNIKDLPAGYLSYLDGDSSIDQDSCMKYQYHDENLMALGDSL